MNMPFNKSHDSGQDYISPTRRNWALAAWRRVRRAVAGPAWAVALAFTATSIGWEFDSAFAQAVGDAQAGKNKSGLCAACHGPTGISINPLWPSLAGQQPAYLAKQIRAFRDGDRVEPTMQPFVQDLTDEDVEDLAAYYASLTPCP